MAEALLELSRQYEKIQVTECNRELTNLERNKEERVKEQLKEIGKMCMLPLKFNGDPRGYTVKCFFFDGSYNTWGGAEEGYGIPTNKREC